jgi:hypothetical protein
MKQIKLPTGEYLLVEVPEDAKQFQVLNEYNVLWYQMPIIRGKSSKELPSGQWEIIGRASELTEDHWDEIVENKWDDYADGMWWKIYDSDQDEWGMCPTESGLSLIKSHSMNPSTTLILKIK